MHVNVFDAYAHWQRESAPVGLLRCLTVCVCFELHSSTFQVSVSDTLELLRYSQRDGDGSEETDIQKDKVDRETD